MHALHATGVALLVLLLAASSVLAGSPKRLTSPLTDDVGALGSGRATAQAAVDRLLSEANIQLWVWFTDSFNGASGTDFAAQTADKNGFGATTRQDRDDRSRYG
jgi:hypothetical protein